MRPHLGKLVCIIASSIAVVEAFIPISTQVTGRRTVSSSTSHPRQTIPFSSSAASRLYMGRLTEKPGDKQEKENDGDVLPKLGEEVPRLTRDQEEAIDLSMGVLPPEAPELTGEEWTAQVEQRLQEMYEKGTYDPTPVNLTPQELAKQQWMDDFLNKEERPIQWNLQYWFGTWTRPDTKFSSPGRGLKSFGFALVGIGLITLMYLIEDELINPIFEDYQKWDGNDIFHFTEDLGAWVTSVPGRASNYVTHFNWLEWSTRVAARAGAAPRWYQQMLPGLPVGDQPTNGGGM